MTILCPRIIGKTENILHNTHTWEFGTRGVPCPKNILDTQLAHVEAVLCYLWKNWEREQWQWQIIQKIKTRFQRHNGKLSSICINLSLDSFHLFCAWKGVCIFAMAFVGIVSSLPHKVKDNLFLQTAEKLFDSQNKVRHQIMVEESWGEKTQWFMF